MRTILLLESTTSVVKNGGGLGYLCGAVGLEFLVGAVDALNVISRFGVGRNAVAETLHFVWAGVVRSQRQIEIVVVLAEQVAKVTRAAIDIFFRVENILHAEARRGLRHQLHQPARVAPRNRFWVEVGFRRHHTSD